MAGNSITILYIKRVGIVGEAGTVISGKLKHLPLLIACVVELEEYPTEDGL